MEEAGCRYTQVLEPAAIDVRSSGRGAGGCRHYDVAVAGRGTEVLEWQLN